MLSSLFAPFRRNIGTVLLSLVLAGLLAYYALGYLPSREADLRRRHFQVLARVGENLRERIQVYSRISEGLAFLVAHHPDKLLPKDDKEQSVATKQSAIRQAWNQPYLQSFNSGKLQFKDLKARHTSRFNIRQTGITFLPIQEQNICFIQPVWENVKNSKQDSLHRFDLITTLPMAQLLHDLRRADVFEHFMVFSDEGQLLYTTSSEVLPTLPWSSQLFGKKTIAKDSVILYTGQVLPKFLAGKDYWLFLQPLRIDSEHTILLGGAVPTSLFRNEKMQLPGGVLELVLALLLIGTLLLPFLKIVIMGPRERLNRQDVVLCGASLVLGSGILMLALQADLSRRILEVGILDRQLRQLAMTAEDTLNNEVGEIRNELVTVDKDVELLKRPANWPVSQPFSTTSPRHKSNRLSFTAWVGSSGWISHGLINSKGIISGLPLYIANVHQRRYFKLAQQKATITPSPISPFVIDGIVSYKDVSKTAVLAMSSRHPDTIVISSTSLSKFQKIKLAPGFSYCLIDSTGEIIFHSNQQLALSANLLQDCESNGQLRAAMFANVADSITVSNQGDEYRIFIKPIKFIDLAPIRFDNITRILFSETRAIIPYPTSSTLGRFYTNQQKLYIVTLADLGYLSAHHMQDLTLALLLLCLIWSGVLGFLAVQWLLQPRPLLQVVPPQSFAIIWPRNSYKQRYLAVAVAGFLGAILLGLLSKYVTPISQLGGCLLLPLALYLYTLWQLTTSTTGAPETYKYFKGLQIARAIAVVSSVIIMGLLWWLVGWHEWLWTFFLLIALLVLFWLVEIGTTAAIRLAKILGRLQRIPLERRPRNFTAWVSAKIGALPSTMHYRYAYSLLLLAWIVVLGLLPAGLCYRIAYQTERQIQVRYAHLSLLSQLNGKWRKSQLQNKIDVPIASFFFGTKLQSESLLHKTDSATFLNRVKNARYGARTTQLNRRLLTHLHPSFADRTQEAQNILEATYNQQSLPQWQVVNSNNYQKMGSAAPATLGDSTWLVSHLPEPWASNAWFFGPGRHAVGAGLASLLFLIGLWGLLVYLIKKLFAPALVQHVSRCHDLPVGPERPVLSTFLLTPGGSTLLDLPPTEFKKLVQPFANRVVIDCRYITDKSSLPKLAGVDLIVLECFETCPDDAEATLTKTQLLRYFQQVLTSRILILSRIHPMAFSDCGHPPYQECGIGSHAKIRMAGALLLDELAYFQVHYIPLHTTQTQTQPPPGILNDLQSFMMRECSRLAFLRKLIPELTPIVNDLHLNGYRLEQSSVVLMIQRMAQFYYRSLWQILAPQEQYVLLDLAQDGLVNSRNILVLDSLLQKGYVRLNSNGRLQVINESFRTFILSSLRQQEALRYEREEDREGTWARLQLPLILVLSAGALFVFITQRSVLNEAQTFLTLLAGLVPTLFKLLPSNSLTSTSRGNAEIQT